MRKKNYKIKILFIEQGKQREEKEKKWINKRNRDINLFLNEKEKINEEKKDNNDYYNSKYELNAGKADDILYKKNSNIEAIISFIPHSNFNFYFF